MIMVSVFFVHISKFYFLESTFYLGAALSSWTQTVLTDRITRKNFKHDSVLKIVTNGRNKLHMIMHLNFLIYKKESNFQIYFKGHISSSYKI